MADLKALIKQGEGISVEFKMSTRVNAQLPLKPFAVC